MTRSLVWLSTEEARLLTYHLPHRILRRWGLTKEETKTLKGAVAKIDAIADGHPTT